MPFEYMSGTHLPPLPRPMTMMMQSVGTQRLDRLVERQIQALETLRLGPVLLDDGGRV